MHPRAWRSCLLLGEKGNWKHSKTEYGLSLEKERENDGSRWRFFWCVQAVALEIQGYCQCTLAVAFGVCLFHVLCSQPWERNTRWWYSCIQSQECIKIAIPETNTFNQYLGHGCLRNAFFYAVLGYSTQYRVPCSDVAMLTELSTCCKKIWDMSR